MKNIHYIQIARLRGAGFTQFLTDVDQIVTGTLSGPSAGQVQEEMSAFTAAKAAVDEAYTADHASPITIELQAIDARRDDAVVGLTLVVRGHTYSPDAAQKAAGVLLLRAIEVYDGIATKSLQDETGAITNLLSDLQGKPDHAAAITLLNLDIWTTELSQANTLFGQKYLARNTELAAEDSRPEFVQLRRNADAAWSKLRERIDALYIVNRGALPWSTAVNQLNSLIDQYNATLARRLGGGDDEEKA